ncbi:MAG: hypothetical protein NVS3B5_08140 [Sphingomicrobium sp.]
MTQESEFTGTIPDIYDRYVGPMLFEPYARDMASRLKDLSGSLLETAAGTGRFTRAIAEFCPHTNISATDLSEPMLAKGGRANRQLAGHLPTGRRL